MQDQTTPGTPAAMLSAKRPTPATLREAAESLAHAIPPGTILPWPAASAILDAIHGLGCLGEHRLVFVMEALQGEPLAMRVTLILNPADSDGR